MENKKEAQYRFEDERVQYEYIFFYDEITISKIKEITGYNDLVFNYGEIKDYELVFGGDYPSLNGAISNIKEKKVRLFMVCYQT